MFRFVNLFLMLCLVPFIAHANDYLVRPDGSGDFTTIQAALDAATDNDVILLAEGTFTGEGNRNLDFHGKDLTVCSTQGNPITCIIDCEGRPDAPHQAFIFTNGESEQALVANLTIKNGYQFEPGRFNTKNRDAGGGIIVREGANPTILNVRFIGDREQRDENLVRLRKSLPGDLGEPQATSMGSVILEDFESGNLNQYTHVGNDESYADPASAHDGNYGLYTQGGYEEQWIYRDDEQAIVRQGDTIGCWVRLNSSYLGRSYFGFGASAGGCYCIVLAPNTNTFLIYNNPGYTSYLTLAETTQNWLADHWYYVEVGWDNGGGIQARLYDSDGTTLLNELQATDNSIQEGGIAFRAFSDWLGGSFDTATLPNALDGVQVGVSGVVNGIWDLDNLAASQTGATDGFDVALDIPSPPPAPANYLSLYFPHVGWPLGDRYDIDVREIYDPMFVAKTWHMAVETDQSGAVTLSFDPSFQMDEGIDLKLLDHATGNLNDLFPSLTYTYEAGGGEYSRDFDLIIGTEDLSPPLSPTSRSMPAGWSMVGFPLLPEPPGTLGSVILDQPVGTAYLYSFMDTMGYQMASAEDPAEQGEGLWIVTDQAFDWTMSGIKDLSGAAVPLRNGWTMVGYPLWFGGGLAGVMVDHGGMRYQWWEAVSDGIVSASVFSYDNASNDYVTVADLMAWHGYWIAGLRDDISLWFDWENLVTQVGFAQPPDESSLPPAQCWRCPIWLEIQQTTVAEAVFGVSAIATDGFDAAFDFPVPPDFPLGTSSRISFSHPEWGLKTGDDFITDIAAPTNGSMQFEATLRAPGSGTASLKWDISQLPEDIDFEVYLVHEDQVILNSIRQSPGIDLTFGNEPEDIQFRRVNATSGLPEYRPSEYRLFVSPNPFNPQTEISFSLPSAGRAVIKIFDLQGRIVRTYDSGQLPPGTHHLIWNGRDDHGRDVASGVFFGVLYADGVKVGSPQKMSLVR